MTSQETTTYLARSLRLQRLARAALLVLFLGQLLTGRVRGAEDAADPYDTLYEGAKNSIGMVSVLACL